MRTRTLIIYFVSMLLFIGCVGKEKIDLHSFKIGIDRLNNSDLIYQRLGADSTNLRDSMENIISRNADIDNLSPVIKNPSGNIYVGGSILILRKTMENKYQWHWRHSSAITTTMTLLSDSIMFTDDQGGERNAIPYIISVGDKLFNGTVEVLGTETLHIGQKEFRDCIVFIKYGKNSTVKLWLHKKNFIIREELVAKDCLEIHFLDPRFLLE